MEIYLHTYCRKDYRHIVLDKISKLKLSGLWNNMNKLYIPVSGMKDNDKEFFEDLKCLSPKIKIFEHSNPIFNNEPDTLNYIRSRAEKFENNIPILYMHTKGVTYDNPIVNKNVKAWVRYLDLWCIGHWEENIKALQTYDTSGGCYYSTPMKHYSGNFWWANSDYIKTLPTLDNVNIKPLERGEFWICSGENSKNNNIGSMPLLDLYQNYYCNESDFKNGF